MQSEQEALLTPLRLQIDAIDSRMVALVAERMACVEQVIALKRGAAIPARLENRIEAVVARVRAEAKTVGAPPDLAEVLWRTMIEWVIAYEDDHLDPDTPPSGEQAA